MRKKRLIRINWLNSGEENCGEVKDFLFSSCAWEALLGGGEGAGSKGSVDFTHLNIPKEEDVRNLGHLIAPQPAPTGGR